MSKFKLFLEKYRNLLLTENRSKYGSVANHRHGTGFLHKDGRYVDVGVVITHDDYVWDNWEHMGLPEEPSSDYPTDDAFVYDWLRIARSGNILYVGDEDVYSVDGWMSSIYELVGELKKIDEVILDTHTIWERD